MKNLILTLICTIILLNFAHAQTDDWINYKIDEKLSVKLPARPTNISRGIEAQSKDSLICFVGLIAETDSAKLAEMVLTPDFTSGLKAAMAEGQEGVVLGDM